MPTINFDGPELTREQKAELVKGFTKVASQVLGKTEKAFTVYIWEIGQENVGVGGELMAEKNEKGKGK